MQKVLKYWPVALIYAVSVAFGLLWITTVQHQSIYHFLEGFVGLFMILFGIIKLNDLNGFVKRFASYDLITKQYRAYGYAYPFIEISIGVAMLVWSNAIVNFFMLFIAIIGLISVYGSIIKKQRLYCACLGTAFNVPLSYVAMFENTTMLVSAVMMLLLGHKAV